MRLRCISLHPSRRLCTVPPSRARRDRCVGQAPPVPLRVLASFCRQPPPPALWSWPDQDQSASTLAAAARTGEESPFLTSLIAFHPIPANGTKPIPSSKPSCAIFLGSLKVEHLRRDQAFAAFPMLRQD